MNATNHSVSEKAHDTGSGKGNRLEDLKLALKGMGQHAVKKQSNCIILNWMKQYATT